jgi:hypothetical protein
MAYRDYMNPTKSDVEMMKFTGRVKASIASMLLPVLTYFALYRPTTDDIALRKG